MNFYEGQVERLKELYGALGAGRVVRDLVAFHLKKVDKRAAAKVEELDIEV